MSVLVAHPTGNPNSHALVRGLCEAGMLDTFVTSLALPKELAEMPFLPRSFRRECSRRVHSGIPRGRIATAPVRELFRIAANRLGWNWLTVADTGWSSIEQVNRIVAARGASELGRLP